MRLGIDAVAVRHTEQSIDDYGETGNRCCGQLGTCPLMIMVRLGHGAVH